MFTTSTQISTAKMNIEGKRIIWSEYQKEIADNDFFYVRSCVRQSFFPGSETTFLKILREELGKNISEHPFHTTCTGIAYHSDIVPFETTMTVIARQFALMTEAGFHNYVPSCITSFGMYNEVLETWHHFPEIEEKTREGITEEEAFKIAVNKIGKVNEIGNEFYKTDTTNKLSGKPSWQAPKFMPSLLYLLFNK